MNTTVYVDVYQVLKMSVMLRHAGIIRAGVHMLLFNLCKPESVMHLTADCNMSDLMESPAWM